MAKAMSFEMNSPIAIAITENSVKFSGQKISIFCII